ncbi:MAG: hypothetical protein WKG07_03975 [Hymenobacter sp.]
MPAAVRAQEFKMKFNGPANRKVVLDMRGSDVTVEGYDGDELLIRGTGRYEAPARAGQRAAAHLQRRGQ